MLNENLQASDKAEIGPVTADQRVASSEAIVANRSDIKQFTQRVKAVKKEIKKTKKPVKKSAKKTK